METTMSKERLDQANTQLGHELRGIKSSLDIYTIIGLNARTIKTSRALLGFVQKQSLGAVVLGLAKVFEREKMVEGEVAYPLCSVGGVYRLAKQELPQNMTAVQAFVSKYGITASDNWTRDVDQVFTAKQPWLRRHMRLIKPVRNTKVAHIQQLASASKLPSIAAFEELLVFAFEFYAFVEEAFFNVAQSHPILEDRRIAGSLLNLLRKAGMGGLVSKFEDIQHPLAGHGR
jgi:hypothetical protein